MAVSIWFRFVSVCIRHNIALQSVKWKFVNIEWCSHLLVSVPSDTLYFFKSKWDWRNRIWVCEPSGSQKIWILAQDQQPRHQCQHPMSFNTLVLSFAPLWHIRSAQHVCLHYAAFLCVRLRVWSIWLPVFPQLGSLTLSSVCSCITGLLFPRLHRPLMITEIQYSPNPHTHGIRSGIIQWQQALGFTRTIS